MDRAPALDASRPSPLRLAGFLVTVLGALLSGIAATLTWVTVGIEVAEALNTPTKGVDITDGRVVLACAVVMLVAVLATRVVSSPTVRRAAAGLVIVAGVVTFAIGGAFVMTASSRFDPVQDEEIVSAVAGALGATEDEVRGFLEESLEELRPFTEVGPGPYLAIAGGLIGAFGGVLVLAWTTRRPDAPEPTGDEASAGPNGTADD